MPNPSAPSIPSDRQSQRFRALYPIAGLVVAVVCMGAGIALFLLRTSGQTDWEGTFIWVHLKVNTQAPGTVCFLVGAVVVYLTRPKRS